MIVPNIVVVKNISDKESFSKKMAEYKLDFVCSDNLAVIFTQTGKEDFFRNMIGGKTLCFEEFTSSIIDFII